LAPQFETLDAMLDVGVALDELKRDGNRYCISGKRALAPSGQDGDSLAALIEEFVTCHGGGLSGLWQSFSRDRNRFAERCDCRDFEAACRMGARAAFPRDVCRYSAIGRSYHSRISIEKNLGQPEC
jgi:hypothetical protein